jgi:hypothetical protein
MTYANGTKVKVSHKATPSSPHPFTLTGVVVGVHVLPKVWGSSARSYKVEFEMEDGSGKGVASFRDFEVSAL